MVSIPTSGDKFFAIFSRKDFKARTSGRDSYISMDNAIFVPQNIFPKSPVIDMIKQNSRNGIFYINRDKDDMKHVVNYLSGQSYDISKTNLIKEILNDDFKIDTKIDCEGNDEWKSIENKDHEKRELMGDILNEIKQKYRFAYVPIRNKPNMYIMYLYDQTEPNYASSKILDEIKSCYKQVADAYDIDILNEISKLMIAQYPFLMLRDGKGSLVFEFGDSDLDKLKGSIYDAAKYNPIGCTRFMGIEKLISFYLL
jgi:hypothetical protein